jgi:CRP-like cAMP-binding protein
VESEQILSLIDKIDFFSDFTQEEKNMVASFKNSVHRYNPNEKIIGQGEADFSLFVVLKGVVVITRDEQPNLVINKLKQGAVFGELSILGKRLRATNVIAEGDVFALKIDGEYLDQIDSDLKGKFKDKCIEILVKRLDEMNETIMKIVR